MMLWLSRIPVDWLKKEEKVSPGLKEDPGDSQDLRDTNHLEDPEGNGDLGGLGVEEEEDGFCDLGETADLGAGGESEDLEEPINDDLGSPELSKERFRWRFKKCTIYSSFHSTSSFFVHIKMNYCFLNAVKSI